MSYDKDYKDENLWLMYGDCLERLKPVLILVLIELRRL